mmetsp:Transcript_19924/g.22783  ORF Transcript_19924/g.22783 Transcript_19924/m.22783 type:complete len:124 (-) Transcript_19924:23-394(-)
MVALWYHCSLCCYLQLNQGCNKSTNHCRGDIFVIIYKKWTNKRSSSIESILESVNLECLFRQCLLDNQMPSNYIGPFSYSAGAATPRSLKYVQGSTNKGKAILLILSTVSYGGGKDDYSSGDR